MSYFISTLIRPVYQLTKHSNILVFLSKSSKRPNINIHQSPTKKKKHPSISTTSTVDTEPQSIVLVVDQALITMTNHPAVEEVDSGDQLRCAVWICAVVGTLSCCGGGNSRRRTSERRITICSIGNRDSPLPQEQAYNQSTKGTHNRLTKGNGNEKKRKRLKSVFFPYVHF